MTPDEQEIARRNNTWGWSLLALAIVLALGTAAIGLIYNAVASY